MSFPVLTCHVLIHDSSIHLKIWDIIYFWDWRLSQWCSWR